MIVEALVVQFNGEDHKVVPFNKKHKSVPTVLVTPQISSPADANINVFIKTSSTIGCEINTSENFVGFMHVQAWSNS